MNQPPIEVADIVRACGARFMERSRRWLHWSHVKVLNAIARCRSAALGGHRDQCPNCGHQAISYNSCRNRHCPKCQTAARDGCATWKRRSSGRAARLPVVLEAVVEVAASQGDDGVGSADRPEHAGLFETRADYGFAAGFDDARADEQMLGAECGVAHALGVFLKVVGLDADLFRQLRIG